METKKELADRCYRQFSALLFTAVELERVPRDFGTGENLYPSEIHTIDAIGSNPGSSISDIARAVGNTRATVQQISTKLENKGYIKRSMSPHDSKRIFLSLTDTGETAREGHRAYHENMYDTILSKLVRLSRDELINTMEIFTIVEDHFNKYLYNEGDIKHENSNM